MPPRSARTPNTHVGRLFQRANRWQKAMVVVCGLVALHGLWVVFVAPVQVVDSGRSCPPAVIAAFVGAGDPETEDGSPEPTERHDADCATTGRRWLVAGLLQTGVALVWALATLELARAWRRSKREKRRRARQARRRGAAGDGAERR